MAQQRQFQMEGNNNNSTNDTKLTKIFVGGLAWETQRDTMRRYFEQFGEIVEAVVITDKNTGRSKGYGFVTFKEADAATRACQNMNPVIDGRRANCNLACLGAQKPRPPSSSSTHGFAGTGRLRSPGSGVGLVAPSPQFRGSSSSSSSAFVHQNTELLQPSSLWRTTYFTIYGIIRRNFPWFISLLCSIQCSTKKQSNSSTTSSSSKFKLSIHCSSTSTSFGTISLLASSATLELSAASSTSNPFPPNLFSSNIIIIITIFFDFPLGSCNNNKNSGYYSSKN